MRRASLNQGVGDHVVVSRSRDLTVDILRGPAYDALPALGESSLAIYILHLIAIRCVLKPLWPRVEVPTFGALYVALAGSMVVIAYGLRMLKRHWRPRVLPLDVVLGG
jgi:fucose 4-O-acetylase-like acetyltransferase